MSRVIFLLLLIILSACAPTASTEAPSIGDERPTSTPVSEDATEAPTELPTEEPTQESVPLGEAEEAVIKQLAANLGLEESDISVLTSEETEFGDACLDVAMEGVLCAQVMTPGRTIVLEANDVQYEYHTSEDGSRIQPASLALIWKREGGIAGFCDTLTVFRSGEVYASKCGSQTEGTMGTFAKLLTSREQDEFHDWITTYGEVELDASDPKGVADRMVITLAFFGEGTDEPTDAEQQDLLNFSQDLYQEVGY